MRFAIAVFGLAAIATAHEISYEDTPAEAAPAEQPAAPVAYGSHKNETTTPPVYKTEVVTAYTTWCPSSTEIEHNGATYTVTEATTLTLPCPSGCTLSKPVYSTSAPAEPTSPVETPVKPVQPPAPHYPAKNETSPSYPAPTGTGAYTPPASTSPIAPGYTGAATKAAFSIGGVLAVAAFIAAL